MTSLYRKGPSRRGDQVGYFVQQHALVGIRFKPFTHSDGACSSIKRRMARLRSLDNDVHVRWSQIIRNLR